MNNNLLLKIFRTLNIILWIIFILILLFYLGIILPEYSACVNCTYEGQQGVDIWGNTIDCYGENKDIGKAFFKFVSVILAGFIIVLGFMFFYIRYLKKRLSS